MTGDEGLGRPWAGDTNKAVLPRDVLRQAIERVGLLIAVEKMIIRVILVLLQQRPLALGQLLTSLSSSIYPVRGRFAVCMVSTERKLALMHTSFCSGIS